VPRLWRVRPTLCQNAGVDLLNKFPIISDQVTKAELGVVLAELQKVLQARTIGDVVELGCYVGTTSLFLQRLLHGVNKTLHVYDSFQGLPAKTAADQSAIGTQYVAGELAATKAQFIANFRKARLPLPVMHKGWFSELKPADLPVNICFAYLDGDFYDSIKDSLALVWPRLSPGATIVVDDYQHDALPGTRKAVDEWLKLHPASLRVQQSLAIIRPK